eukprot:scaffold828_cov117-Amphora_coffeaeformis.AAC.3
MPINWFRKWRQQHTDHNSWQRVKPPSESLIFITPYIHFMFPWMVQVHEAIAGVWIRFEHIPGTENMADVFTKSLAWNVLKTYIKPLLFWKGKTSDALSGHETPLASNVSTNMSVDVNLGCNELMVDVDLNHHNPEQDQDQPAFSRLCNNQYTALMDLEM